MNRRRISPCNLEQWWRKGHVNLSELLPRRSKPNGDPLNNTGHQKLRFLTFGSPTLRFIYHQTHSYVLPNLFDQKPQKLLMCEDIPLSAHFWEMACNLLYVERAVLHSGLSGSERIELIKRFNNPKDSLTILIRMHSVSTQGVNLDAPWKFQPMMGKKTIRTLKKKEWYINEKKKTSLMMKSWLFIMEELSHIKGRQMGGFFYAE